MSSTDIQNTADVLLRHRTSDTRSTIVFPYTRYDNVFASPTIVTDVMENYGAPFHLYQTGTEEVSSAEIARMIGNIMYEV